MREVPSDPGTIVGAASGRPPWSQSESALWPKADGGAREPCRPPMAGGAAARTRRSLALAAVAQHKGVLCGVGRTAREPTPPTFGFAAKFERVGTRGSPQTFGVGGKTRVARCTENDPTHCPAARARTPPAHEHRPLVRRLVHKVGHNAVCPEAEALDVGQTFRDAEGLADVLQGNLPRSARRGGGKRGGAMAVGVFRSGCVWGGSVVFVWCALSPVWGAAVRSIRGRPRRGLPGPKPSPTPVGGSCLARAGTRPSATSPAAPHAPLPLFTVGRRYHVQGSPVASPHFGHPESPPNMYTHKAQLWTAFRRFGSDVKRQALGFPARSAGSGRESSRNGIPATRTSITSLKTGCDAAAGTPGMRAQELTLRVVH